MRNPMPGRDRLPQPGEPPECNACGAELETSRHGDLLDCTSQECCEHEFDPDEGFTCLNCGKQGEPSDVYDEDYGKDR